MTRKQAQTLMDDWGGNLLDSDFCENIYMSIRGMGTRVFEDCCYYDAEGYIFIWKKDESFLIRKKDMGDFVIVPDTSRSLISLKKVT